MTPRFANALASLIVDQWPLPGFIRRRLIAHPDVARQIKLQQQIEHQLRSSAWQPDAFGISTKPSSPVSLSSKTRVTIPHGVRWSMVAAILLVIGGAALSIRLMNNDSQQLAQYEPPPQTEVDLDPLEADLEPLEVDLEPLIASIRASEKVAQDVTKGLENLGGQFTSLGKRWAAIPWKQARGDDSPTG